MGMSLLITGASRGLGLEFTRQYLEAGDNVIATVRAASDQTPLQALKARFGDQLTLVTLDVTDQQSIKALAQQLPNQPIDILINNAGIYGPKNEREYLANLELELWQDILVTNTISPLLVTSALLPNLRTGTLKKVIFISSAYASITTAKATNGSYYYASSKAGLNMTVKKLSDELADEGFTCVAISPGWVKTDMGGQAADLTPEESITRVRTIIDRLTPDDNGRFFGSQGHEMPW